MKVLLLTSSYPLKGYPGWAPFLKETALALAERGHQITVLMFHPENTRREYTEKENPSVKVIADPFLPRGKSRLHREPGLLPSLKASPAAWLELPFYFAASVREILKAVSAESPDIVHAMWYLPMGLLASSLKRLHKRPVAVSALGGDFHLPRLFGPLLRFAAGKADINIACSRYLSEKASAYGLSPEAFHSVPNGVSTARYTTVLKTRVKEKVTIGCAKRLVPEKNVIDLIAAVRALPKTVRSKIEVHIAGDGPETDRIKRAVRDYALSGIVSFRGFIPHEKMAAFFLGMDILVDPSTREGFATSNVEALSSGCVLLAADGYGNREMVSEGRTGSLFPARNMTALALKLEHLILHAEERAAVSSAAAAHAREHFDVSQTASRLEALYRRAIDLKDEKVKSQVRLAPSPAE